jgi:hypothetical protein
MVPLKNASLSLPTIVINEDIEAEDVQDVALELMDDIRQAEQIKYMCCFPLVSFCVGSKASDAILGIEKLLAAFSQGFRLTRTEFTVGLSILSKFHAQIPAYVQRMAPESFLCDSFTCRPKTKQYVTSLEYIENAKYIFRFAMASFVSGKSSLLWDTRFTSLLGLAWT